MVRITSESGVFELMLNARTLNDNAQQGSVFEKAVKMLEEDDFLSEENARHIMSLIADGIGVSYAKDKKCYGRTGRKMCLQL